MAKETMVIQQEKEKMWKLYQELHNFKKVAKKLNVRRTPFRDMLESMKQRSARQGMF